MIYSLFSYFYGEQTSLNHLLSNPLQSDQILMQDRRGNFHRVDMITEQSALMSKIFFWIQTHLNTKDHLDATQNVLKQFKEEKLRNESINGKEDGNRMIAEVEVLAQSLQNGLNAKKLAIKTIIEKEIEVIKSHVEGILEKKERERYQKQEAERIAKLEKQEEAEKKEFQSFKESVKAIVHNIKQENTSLEAISSLATADEQQFRSAYPKIASKLKEYLAEFEKLSQQRNTWLNKIKEGKRKDPRLPGILIWIKNQLISSLTEFRIVVDYLIDNLKINSKKDKKSTLAQELLLKDWRIDWDEKKYEEVHEMKHSIRKKIQDVINQLEHSG